MKMAEQQQRADRDEFSTEMRRIREANATLLKEKQEAHDLAVRVEEQKQAIIQESDAARRQIVAQAEQQMTRDAELQRVLVARAEQMQASAERKTAIAAQRSDSDRELLAMTLQQEVDQQDRFRSFESQAQDTVAQLSGALRTTGDEHADSSRQAFVALEERYRQREQQLREQYQAEARNRLEILDHECKSQIILHQQQNHEAMSTIVQLQATIQTLSTQSAANQNDFASNKRFLDDREQRLASTIVQMRADNDQRRIAHVAEAFKDAE